MLYNDRAVLENHHASASLRLMKDEEFNILSSLKPAEYRLYAAPVFSNILWVFLFMSIVVISK